MNNFHGINKKKSYFEGWYFKQQMNGFAIAFIPALHIDGEGKKTASIQVIVNDFSHNFLFKGEDFSASRDRLYVKIGKNIFSEEGIRINLKDDSSQIKGVLRYTKFKKLKSDIMGPFSIVPFMQCSHGVLSMMHTVKGSLCVNGVTHDFTGAAGYIEKDYGNSFPSSYFWSQCSDWTGKQDCSLMAAAAKIPIGIISFRGCICAICYHGKEYRLATYLGARIKRQSKREIRIRQGGYDLLIRRIDEESEAPDQAGEKDHSLFAPSEGSMNRIIKENISCKVQYRFRHKKKLLFEFISEHASFESVCD